MNFRGFQKGILDYSLCHRCNGIRPFSNCLNPLFQSEAKCKGIEMKKMFYFHENITRFLEKGCAVTLALKNKIFCKLVLVK